MPKSRHLLHALLLYAKSKFYLSCTHQHLHLLSLSTPKLDSYCLASPPKITSSDETCLRLVGKCSKIVSPSHYLQPPTPEVFVPLPTPDVARRSSLFLFLFSKFFFLQRWVLFCFVFLKTDIYIYMFDKMLQ